MCRTSDNTTRQSTFDVLSMKIETAILLSLLLFTASFDRGPPHNDTPPRREHATQTGYLATATSVAGGHGCSIKGNGALECWGLSRPRTIAQPPETGQYVAVSVGERHACAIRSDGKVSCWGQNTDGQTDVPRNLQAIAIWAGRARSCAITNAGENYCWGSRSEHELAGFSWALGSKLEKTSRGVLVTVGDSHSCMLDPRGNSRCWGDMRFKQALVPSDSLRTLDAHGDHNCGIRLDGRIQCWGDSLHAATLPPQGTFRAIDMGQFNGCAVRTNGTGACWGLNSHGQNLVPAGRFLKITTGLNHTCGLRDNGHVQCWGNRSDGRTNAPTGFFHDIDVGEAHSCGLRPNRTISCWGRGKDGQLAVPFSASGYRMLAVGAYHGCALRIDGGINCWGRNDFGQATAPAGRFTEISAGFSHTCGTREDSQIICWGDDSYGQSNLSSQKSTDGSLAVDTTPPTITSVITGTLGDNGWYLSDVRLHFVVSDPESPITYMSGCDDVLITSDTPASGIVHTCWARSEGSRLDMPPTFLSETIKRDATPPFTSMAFYPSQPNSDGWLRMDTQIHYSCADSHSGVPANCSASYMITSEGSTDASFSVRDAAGNVTTTWYIARLDKTPPSVSAVMPAGNIVINTNFDTQFATTDTLSGINRAKTSCTPIAKSIRDSKATCLSVDFAGNMTERTSGYRTVYAFEGFLPPFDNPDALYEVEAYRNLPLTWWTRDANGVPLTEKSFGWYELPQVPCPNLPVVPINWRGPFERTGERILPDGSHRADMRFYPDDANKCVRATYWFLDQSSRTLYFKIRPHTLISSNPLPAVRSSSSQSTTIKQVKPSSDRRQRLERMH